MPYPHKFIRLSREERWLVSAHLQQLAREGKDRERNRLQVIFLSNERLTFQQIMKRLDMCYRTVQNCVYIWKKQGLSSPYFTGLKGSWSTQNHPWSTQILPLKNRYFATFRKLIPLYIKKLGQDKGDISRISHPHLPHLHWYPATPPLDI
jgi:hypothetical protein